MKRSMFKHQAKRKRIAVSLESADLAATKLKLIECPRQPGGLRISKQACARRYLLAHKRKPILLGGEFGLTVRSGLEICRLCPIGRRNSKSLFP